MVEIALLRKLMKNLLLSCTLLFCALGAKVSAESMLPTQENLEVTTQCLPFMKHTEKKLHSKERVDLCQLTAGKAILIVNTASHCGFTPQFTALEALHKKYQDQGLVVLGFPSDDFFQEEDNEKATADICFVNYGVTFTMLSPVHVYGGNAHPIFKQLADKTAAPKWNFYKYLVSADGKLIKHFNSRVTPDSEVFVNTINAIL